MSDFYKNLKYSKFENFFHFRRGNCKTKTMGMQCEIGLRKKTYNVLAGSVLSVWNQVEAVLTHDGNRRGASTKMQVRYLNSLLQNQLQNILILIFKHILHYTFDSVQVVRLKLEDNKRIVGTLIPSSAMSSLLTALMDGSEGSETIETIH